MAHPSKKIDKSLTIDLLKDHNLHEHLSQIGKRIQIYWGTSYPKHFIRTFSEISQLLGNDALGLSILIIDEDNLQKVRLDIEPYYKEPKPKELRKKKFFITREPLAAIMDKFDQQPIDPNKLDSRQPLGIDFCIGKETPEQEYYNYYIVVQAVDLLHSQLVQSNCLPITIPAYTNFIP